MLHALPVSADVGTFSLGDRTEVRVRDPDPITNRAAVDLDTLVDAQVELASAHSLYTLAYTPRLSLLDINGAGIQPALLNGLLASAEWRIGHALIGVREIASYGMLSLESSTLPNAVTPVTVPPGQPPPNAQLVPTVESLMFASSSTSVSSTLTLRPWTVTGTVGYQLSGGTNGAAQQVLPFQQGPLGEGVADLRLGWRDHLVTVLDGLETAFSSPTIDTDVLLVQAQERWKHSWSHTTDTMLSAGASEARTRDAALAPDVYTTDPMAEASLEQRFGHGKSHGSIGLDLRLAPFVNQLAGVADERLQASAVASWSLRRTSLRASGAAAESVDQTSPVASRLVTAEVDLSYAQSEVLSFDLGARALSQDQSYAVTTSTGQTGPVSRLAFSQELVFFAVTFRALKTGF